MNYHEYVAEHVIDMGADLDDGDEFPGFHNTKMLPSVGIGVTKVRVTWTNERTGATKSVTVTVEEDDE